jgi:hypothetical protein
VVTGDAKLLSAHASSHQVTITGTMAKDKDKDVLKATDLKMMPSASKVVPCCGTAHCGALESSL